MSVPVTAALIKLLRLFFHINAKEQPHQPHGQQNAADTKRVGHRVAHPHLIDDIKRQAKIAQDLLPGAKRGGVSDRPREDAENDRKRNIEQFMQDRRHQPAEYDDKNGEQIELKSGDA